MDPLCIMKKGSMYVIYYLYKMGLINIIKTILAASHGCVL